LSSEFVIRKGPKQWEAKIFSGKVEIAEIKKGEGLSFRLVSNKDGLEWVLTNVVHGKHRPFSFSVRKSGKKTQGLYSDGNDLGEEVFVIREQLFKYHGKFYMLANHPEGKSWKDYVNSSVKYICRLDNFPYSDLSEVDHQHYTLRDKIKRFRGIPVGEASGLGIEQRGHRVRLDPELDDVGLFIAAISYLLYASA
jgi:hypothetical protein